jgi:hypothetical protein
MFTSFMLLSCKILKYVERYFTNKKYLYLYFRLEWKLTEKLKEYPSVAAATLRAEFRNSLVEIRRTSFYMYTYTQIYIYT